MSPVTPLQDPGYEAPPRPGTLYRLRPGEEDRELRGEPLSRAESLSRDTLSRADPMPRGDSVSRAEPPRMCRALLALEPAVPGPSLLIAHDPYAARSERVRLLRTELMLRHEGDGANAVALLSAEPGASRSQLAAELAIACAQLERPTLLIDADLHNPAQHRLFGVSNSAGLTDAIASPDKVYLHAVEGVPQLRLLTAGPLPVNPLEMLSDRRFERLLEQWREDFAFIVVDTAPIGTWSGGLAVATLLGRVLVMARAGHTEYRGLREMLRRLASTQARILGAVMSHY